VQNIHVSHCSRHHPPRSPLLQVTQPHLALIPSRNASMHASRRSRLRIGHTGAHNPTWHPTCSQVRCDAHFSATNTTPPHNIAAAPRHCKHQHTELAHAHHHFTSRMLTRIHPFTQPQLEPRASPLSLMVSSHTIIALHKLYTCVLASQRPPRSRHASLRPCGHIHDHLCGHLNQWLVRGCACSARS
jgi:hypothetical protein